jgi:hypothetical protein
VRCAALHASASFAAENPVAKRGSIGFIDDVLFRLAGFCAKTFFLGGRGNEMMKHLHGMNITSRGQTHRCVCGLWFGRAKVERVTWDLPWDHGFCERANGKIRKEKVERDDSRVLSSGPSETLLRVIRRCCYPPAAITPTSARLGSGARLRPKLCASW